MLNFIIIFLSALTVSLVFTFLLSKVSLKFKVLKTGQIPLVGGLAIGLALVISLGLSIVMFNLSVAKVLALAAASLLMLLLGVIDDLKELSVVQKLLGQSFCAILLIAAGIRTEIMYLGFWLNSLITFVWILGITNAFNLLDIMDGLAGGVAFIVAGAFLLIGYFNADLNAQILSLILCASSAGFLFFNFPPARAYLGNSGSHFFGLFIASLALVTHYASSNNVFALASPIMIVGLPVIDTVLLVIFRLIKKKAPFKKSNDHIALKIGSLGFSPLNTVLIMYLLGAIFAACGVGLSRVNSIFGAGIIICVFLLSIGIFLKFVKIETNG